MTILCHLETPPQFQDSLAGTPPCPQDRRAQQLPGKAAAFGGPTHINLSLLSSSRDPEAPPPPRSLFIHDVFKGPFKVRSFLLRNCSGPRVAWESRPADASH